jgi:hypothetical protein
MSEQMPAKHRQASHVQLQPVQARDETAFNRIGDKYCNDRNRSGCGLGCQRRTLAAHRSNLGDRRTSEFHRWRRQSIILTQRPTIFDRQVPSHRATRAVVQRVRAMTTLACEALLEEEAGALTPKAIDGQR